MAYIKFKELTKYFDFKTETEPKDLPDYVIEYSSSNEKIILGYKNSKDYILFTDKKMVLFDRDVAGLYYKKIHFIPYESISTGAINFKPGKVEMLLSLDSGYQLHINFINMNHDKKERIKAIFKIMFENKL